ncbi:MAG: hypothetical protein HY866_03635 [Chloroflexi bacterium]|nr:hypothetical protein [Chloroflexota bacterium]
MSLLACPVDGAALRLKNGVLHCSADAEHVYPFEHGVLRLLPPDCRAALIAQSETYEQECAAQGWHSPDEDEFKSLPQTALSGYPENYWQQQSTGIALLWRFLEAVRLQNGGLPVGPVGEAAVIGAGMGWLAYGLDVAGYTTLALDVRAGDRYGLGVYPIARFLRIQADPLRLPLARGAFDWVIFQEPLSTFGDQAAYNALFEQGLRLLRPNGWIAVMDNLAPSPANAQITLGLFEQAGLRMMDGIRRRGWRGRVSDLRDGLFGRAGAIPPVMVAQKPGG